MAVVDGKTIPIESITGLAKSKEIAAPATGESSQKTGNEVENAENANNEIQQNDNEKIPFLQQIPTDEKGVYLFEAAPVETAIGALKEVYDNETDLRAVVEKRIDKIKRDLEKVQSPKPTGDIQKDIASKQKAKEQARVLQSNLDYWNGVLAAIQPTKESITRQLTGEAEDGENSGKIQEKDGEQAYRQPLSQQQTETLIAQMEANAETAPVLELTPENWYAEFGEDGMVETPVGQVKMGENQLAKLILNKRTDQFGMIKPTLTNPDVVVEVKDDAENVDRNSKYLFIKTFTDKSGEKYTHFESVTVNKEGKEVVVSNHMESSKRVEKFIRNGNLLWNRFVGDSNSSVENQSDTSSATQEQNDSNRGAKPQSSNAVSVDKDTENSAPVQEGAKEIAGQETSSKSLSPTQLQEVKTRSAEYSQQKASSLLSESEYLEDGINKYLAENNLTREEFDELDDSIDIENGILDNYSSYIKSFIDSGKIQSIFDNAKLGDKIKIRKNIETAGFNVSDVLDLEKEKRDNKEARAKKRAQEFEKTKKILGLDVTGKPDGDESVSFQRTGDKGQLPVRSTSRRFFDRVVKRLQEFINAPVILDKEAMNAAYGGDFRAFAEQQNKMVELERVNARFNEELDGVKNGTHKGILSLGQPLDILQAAGINSEGIELAPEVLEKKLKDHDLTTDDLQNLAQAIQTPIMVYQWGTKAKSTIIVTELTTKDGRKITVALRAENKGHKLEVNEVASIHGKAAERFLSEMENAKEGGLQEALKYVDKEKALDWLGLSTLSTSQGLNPTAKVIQEFENPNIAEENSVRMMLAWHGTGADFTRFDKRFILTGEGAMNYGAGFYFTDKRSIAEYYAKLKGRLTSDLVIPSDFFETLSESERQYIDTHKSEIIYDGNYIDVAETIQTLKATNPAIANKLEDFASPFLNQLLKVKIHGDKTIDELNFMRWDKKLTQEHLKILEKALDKFKKNNEFNLPETAIIENIAINSNGNTYTGERVYENLSKELGSDMAASEFLLAAGIDGIQYPTNFQSDQSDKGSYNYVVFDENAIEIDEKIRLMSTSKGEIYGFTKDGKIYIDPNLVNVNTPIHEFGHLLNSAVMKASPEQWKKIVDLCSQTPLWNEIQKNPVYANQFRNQAKKDGISYEDAVADEVFSTLLGYRGENNIDALMRQAGGDMTVFARIVNAINNFWEWIKGNVLGINRRFNSMEGRFDTSTIAELDAIADATLKKMFSGKPIGNEELRAEIARAESETDTNPTEAQKKAGNYRKGHVRIQGFDISIEQPKGSVRRGVDENGKAWETKMHNTYGYFGKTESRDGDHIDVFLGDNPLSEKVFVVDQINPETGKFDEHKVMFGFDDIESARKAYFSNYEKGWKGLGNITETNVETFRKWSVDTDGRRIKPFAEYKDIRDINDRKAGEEQARGVEEFLNNTAEGKKFIESATPERIKTLEATGELITTSEVKDENGVPFVAVNGNIDLGIITYETGLTPAPIRLSEGKIYEDGGSYGLAHISDERKQQIFNAGYNSVEEFVAEVARNYNQIHEGNTRGEKDTYLIEVTDKHNNTLFVELSNDGSYWNVNSAGVLKTKYSAKKKLIWSLPAVGNSTNADAVGVNRGTTKGATTTSGNSPQIEDKGITKNVYFQIQQDFSQSISQSFSSAKTSLRQVASAIKKITWEKGST
ncbi:MAG: hypothetical protein LBH19_07945, partial [Dysgonamonadaceae bacterium]|nr:hypothetical protein [Dysgonamonadaceae bacterium]